MSKRRATNQLTKEDYEREEEEEEAPGQQSIFRMADEQVASRDVLNRRSVLKAKRRTSVLDDSNVNASPSPFSGIKLNPSNTGPFSFTANYNSPAPLFGVSSGPKPQVGNPSQPMSFGSGNQKQLFSFGSGHASSTTSTATESSVKLGFSVIGSSGSSASAPSSSSKLSNDTSSAKPPMATSTFMTNSSNQTSSNFNQDKINSVTVNGINNNGSGSSKSPEFCSKLRSLNSAFVSFINSFSSENNLYDFSPACDDYLKHVKKLQEGNSDDGPTQPPKVSVPSIPMISSPANSVNPVLKTTPLKPQISPKTQPFATSSAVQPSFSFSPSVGAGVNKIDPVPAKTLNFTASNPPKDFSPPKPLFGAIPPSSTPGQVFGSPLVSSAPLSTAPSSGGFSFSAAASGVKFGGNNGNSAINPSSGGFSFGLMSSQSNQLPAAGSTQVPSFSFGSSLQPASSASPFSSPAMSLFGTSNSFSSTASFKPSSLGQTTESTATGGDEEGEYVPPKNEEINVEEKDSIYSKRVKLFFMSGGAYETMGVGMLHVKKLENGKHQLIVRGENAIGSIWLNTQLAPVIPVERKGKKDVHIVAVVSTPPTSKSSKPGMKNGEDGPKSVSYLLRCADDSHADELKEKLNYYKNL